MPLRHHVAVTTATGTMSVPCTQARVGIRRHQHCVKRYGKNLRWWLIWRCSLLSRRLFMTSKPCPRAWASC